MADQVVASGKSRVEIAYELVRDIRGMERIDTRKTLLDAYAECLDAVIGARSYPKSQG